MTHGFYLLRACKKLLRKGLITWPGLTRFAEISARLLNAKIIITTEPARLAGIPVSRFPANRGRNCPCNHIYRASTAYQTCTRKAGNTLLMRCSCNTEPCQPVLGWLALYDPRHDVLAYSPPCFSLLVCFFVTRIITYQGHDNIAQKNWRNKWANISRKLMQSSRETLYPGVGLGTALFL